MKIYNITKIAYRSLVRNKMRAVLTMLGIIIGISSVIAMVSIGESSTYNIKKEISSTGANMIYVIPYIRDVSGANYSYTDTRSLKMSDITEIKKHAKYIGKLSPHVSTSGQFIYGKKNYPSSLSGVDSDYFAINNSELERGTIFNAIDVASSAKVCIIGKNIERRLFGVDQSAVGKSIRFKDIPLLVIGVMQEKGQGTMGMNDDDVVYVPYTTIQNRILSIEHIQTIYASAIPGVEASVAAEELTTLLRRSHKLTGSRPNDFETRTQADMLKMVDKVTGMLTALLAAIGSISLLVGGIGIMNIMYVTVTERTKEIGLRMAIGAQSTNILFQFLSESVMLCFVGGIIGIIIGIGMAYSITYALDWPFIISPTSIILSFIVCGTVGVFFGWYPAKKASQMDPINALRYE